MLRAQQNVPFGVQMSGFHREDWNERTPEAKGMRKFCD